MKTLTWTGSKGNVIELKAECKIEMAKQIIDLDGDKFEGKEEPKTNANLELYVDGKKVDSCWNINFWKIIDIEKGLKKVWGLKVAMAAEQAILVENFLNGVIENGKSIEVIKNEKMESEKEAEEALNNAKEIIAKYENQSLKLTNIEYKRWVTKYNNINNDGGEGYVPTLITTEQYNQALVEVDKKY